ncbi:hypothetical protein BD626DRAFT_259796 [Schizophyllum amplum]|uniref:Uncharacterized protein n=1 Tax=Schizophyllum amplum TaxID=97359 RepID=A0A550BUI2_9AGAR|nr:hypothetical protein BD626DRAFT_259796 [Auriculariopsis ampla]
MRGQRIVEAGTRREREGSRRAAYIRRVILRFSSFCHHLPTSSTVYLSHFQSSQSLTSVLAPAAVDAHSRRVDFG